MGYNIKQLTGLKDLISNITPTFSSWTVDPTDGAHITDNDPTTSCTTGNKVAAGGYQSGYMTWDLGKMYNIITSIYGCADVTAGTAYLATQFWDGAGWHSQNPSTQLGTTPFHAALSGSRCSMVRIALYSSAAATIEPNIYLFNVWRVR